LKVFQLPAITRNLAYKSILGTYIKRHSSRGSLCRAPQEAPRATHRRHHPSPPPELPRRHCRRPLPRRQRALLPKVAGSSLVHGGALSTSQSGLVAVDRLVGTPKPGRRPRTEVLLLGCWCFVSAGWRTAADQDLSPRSSLISACGTVHLLGDGGAACGMCGGGGGGRGMLAASGVAATGASGA
jgi:hypothetical protein